VAALAAGAVIATVRARKNALQRNEAAQKAAPGINYYVSVDRSGGGI
jgi:hypothetical protein